LSPVLWPWTALLDVAQSFAFRQASSS